MSSSVVSVRWIPTSIALIWMNWGGWIQAEGKGFQTSGFGADFARNNAYYWIWATDYKQSRMYPTGVDGRVCQTLALSSLRNNEVTEYEKFLCLSLEQRRSSRWLLELRVFSWKIVYRRRRMQRRTRIRVETVDGQPEPECNPLPSLTIKRRHITAGSIDGCHLDVRPTFIGSPVHGYISSAFIEAWLVSKQTGTKKTSP